MSVSGIAGSNYILPQTNQVGNTPQTGSAGGDSDGDNDGSRVSGASGGSRSPGAFLSAIFQALSQAGVSGAPASTATPAAAGTPAQDPLQALGAFMHNLFSALQSQGGQAAQTGQPAAQTGGDSDGDNDGSTGGAGAAGGHHRHGGGIAQMESNLQNLIQQLSSSASGSTATGASTTAPAAGTTAAASSSNLGATLQQSYQNLLSSMGVSGNASSLSDFLQAFSQNLQGIGSSGNVVNTKA